MNDLFDRLLDESATDERLDPAMVAEQVGAEVYRPGGWGVAMRLPNSDRFLLMLTTQVFASEEQIAAREDYEVFEGCKVQAERAARRWPLGHCLVVRLL